MFPGRFWVALGSGENVNEHVTGEAWPRKEERVLRLEESVDVIRRLLAGEVTLEDVDGDEIVGGGRRRLLVHPQAQRERSGLLLLGSHDRPPT